MKERQKSIENEGIFEILVGLKTASCLLPLRKTAKEWRARVFARKAVARGFGMRAGTTGHRVRTGRARP